MSKTFGLGQLPFVAGFGSSMFATARPEVKRRFTLALALLLVLLAVAVMASWLAPYDPNGQLFGPLEAPSAAHPAGTDRFGRDLFARILVGLRTSVFSTLALVLVVSITGTAVGVACAWRGGVFDAFLMRVSDICLAFPGLVFPLAVAAVLQGGLLNAIFALALIGWPKYARLSRSRTLALKSAPFLDAARLSGSTDLQLIMRHVLPNVIGPVVVTAVLDVGTLMMELAGLSFLGLGAQPPTAELGNMMSSGRSLLQSYPWVVLAPGVAILWAVSTFNFFGDALRDLFDPNGTKLSQSN